MTNKPNRVWLQAAGFLASIILTGCASLTSFGMGRGNVTPSHQPTVTQQLTPSLPPETPEITPFVLPPSSGYSLDLVYARTLTASAQDIFGYTVATNASVPITQAATVEGSMTLYPNAWSPDGNAIVVVWNRPHGPDNNPCELHPEVTAECKTVYLLDAKSLSAKPLFTFAQIQLAYMGGAIYWSPDGHSLVYAGADPQTGQGYLAIYDISTATSRYLIQESASSTQFCPLGWSPDGKEVFYLAGTDRIMVQSLPRYNQVIFYKVAVATLDIEEVFDPQATVGRVELSPVNSYQMVAQITSPDWTEYARDFTLTFIDLSTGQNTVLGDQGLNNGFRFSPDGKSLGFTRGGKEPQELCFWSVDKEAMFCAADSYFTSASTVEIGSWLPDSQSMVVYRTSNFYDLEKYQLDTILVRPDGSRAETLASACPYTSDNPACDLSRIVWNPNYQRP